MGILRADRITGLGGANAIKGSVFFDGASTITVEDSDDFYYDGDFTIEGWAFATGRDNQMMLLGQWDGSGSVAGSLAWAIQFTNDSNGFLRFLTSSSGTNVVLNKLGTSGTFFDNQWHHFAVTRNGNDYKLFTDGVVVGSVTDSNAIFNSPFPLTIGGTNRRYTSNADSNQTFTGFLSNIRIIKGEALYTAAFTPPTSELTVTPNTVFLGCQSSNILREETGKILSIDKSNTNNSGPISSRFTPNSPVGFSTTTDVGSQYGTTFDGFGSFATSTYMVPTGGNTRERNRGRGVFIGGGGNNNIDFIDIQSSGIAQDFGDKTSLFKQGGSVASSTRAVNAGGFENPAFTNIMDFITIANTANATDFGDLTLARRNIGGAGNSTRGIFFGGGSPSVTDTIDFITIATAGNASDFGNTTSAKSSVGSFASPTRAVFGGGESNAIEFLTIATTGDATDFGDLISGTTEKPAGTSSSTRGLFICGESQPAGTRLNTIQFVTIATTGNATDFGDHTDLRRSLGACNNSIRAVYGGGNTPSATVNTLSFVTIATTGNGQDFGDLTLARSIDHGSSDSHGGLA